MKSNVIISIVSIVISFFLNAHLTFASIIAILILPILVKLNFKDCIDFDEDNDDSVDEEEDTCDNLGDYYSGGFVVSSLLILTLVVLYKLFVFIF